MVDVEGQGALLAEKVELAIGGQLYSGWTEIAIERALSSIAGRFELVLASKESAAGQLVQIAEGDPCEVRVGGAVVIDGFVDAKRPVAAAQEHRISISGRDRSADLVDCSAIHRPGAWSRAKIETIAADLAKPFGISVTAKVSTGAAIARFALQPGETVFAAIERLLRFRGLLLTGVPGGGLEIVKPGQGAVVATLEWGKNILGGAGAHDASQRFSDYIVKGQASGNDQKNGKTVAQIRGEAKDAGVRRYRPLLLIAEDQSDGASARTRAAWEAGVRAGQAKTVDIDVLGWRTRAGGELWRPDLKVRVKCAPLDVPDMEMLVAGVRLSKSEAGTVATLTCNPPGAWQQLAEGKA